MTSPVRGALDRSLPFLLLIVPACLAPRPEGGGAENGTLEEFGGLMSEGGAQPVVGLVEDGAGAGIEEIEPEPVVVLEELEFEEPEVEQSPYIRFGERILLRDLEDGTQLVTKPYLLPTGRPAKIVQLMGALEPFPFRERPAADAEGELTRYDPSLVEYQILEKLDEEFYTVFSTFETAPQQPTSVVLSDVFVVTATANRLGDFEEFLDLFTASGIPQIELEAKIIEIVERDSLDVGVESSWTFGASNFVKQFAYDLPNFAESSEALLQLGTIQDDVVFDAIIQAVKNWQNVSIESRPKTVVRAGGVARIDAITEIPFLEVKTLAPDGTFTTSIEYKKTGTQLWISPRKVGANTLALDVHLEGSQQVGSQVTLGVSGGALLEVPIITYRTAKTVVYLEPGQTLVIGGLTQERDQEIINKVPLLGDLPIVGFFFRSTFVLKERQHVMFAISPRIIQRSDFDTDL